MGGHDRDPFTELADAARGAEAARERTAARWLRQQAAEEATLVGILVDLAEARDAVAVRTRSGRVHRGPIDVVGADFVVVGTAWVPVGAVVSVRTDPSRVAVDATGRRTAARDRRLCEALADLAAERRDVVIVTDTGEPLRGQLLTAAPDVVTLVLDGDTRVRCHVAVAAVTEIVVVG